MTIIIATAVGFVIYILVSFINDYLSSHFKNHKGRQNDTITFLPMIGFIMNMMYWPIVVPILSLLIIIFWLFLMYKAFIGERYKLPIIGDFIEKQMQFR